MASMMNGFYYDEAPEGHNTYEVRIANKTIITNADYNSAIIVYKDVSSHDISAQLVKVFDRTNGVCEEILKP